METLKISLTAIFQFYKNLKSKTKIINEDTDNVEFSYPKFGVNLKQTFVAGKVQNSLFHHMYSEENEMLFI